MQQKVERLVGTACSVLSSANQDGEQQYTVKKIKNNLYGKILTLTMD
jgi:hypothetical protein